MKYFRSLISTKANFRLLWMIISIGILAITGCGGTDSSLDSNAGKSAVVLIGQPDAPLADELSANFHLTEMGSEPHAPVLVYLVDDGEYYDESVVTYIKKAFEAGHPVALLNPNTNDIEAFNGYIGFDFDAHHIVEESGNIYGVDKNNIGKNNVLFLDAQPNSTTMPVTINTYEEGELVDTETENMIISASDEYLEQNITMLREWIISEEQERNTTVDVAAAAKAKEQVLKKVAAADQKNILDLSTIGDVNVSFRGSYQTTGGPWNTYAIDHQIWRIYDQDHNNDYILINQSASLNAAPGIIMNSEWNRGYYVVSYQIGNRLVDDQGNLIRIYDASSNPIPTLDRTSIKTYTGISTVSENFTWKLEGKISGKVSEKPEIGAEIGGGVSYSKTNSYQIPDVTVQNMSNNLDGFASSAHLIARPTPTGVFVATFTEIKALAKATYEPSNQILYKLPDVAYNGNESARNRFPTGIYLTTELSVVMGHSHHTQFARPYKEYSYQIPLIGGKQIITWPLYYPDDIIDIIKPGQPVGQGDYRWQNLSSKDMSSVTFDQINLTGSLISQAVLRKATFNSVKLVETNFTRSDLSEAVFANTTFLNTGFKYAKLQGASFRSADLKGVDFSGADLSGADLTGAKVVDNGINFSGTKLSKTKWYDGTICPEYANSVIKGPNNTLQCIRRN